MDTLKMTEQDIVNALCLHIAAKKQLDPYDVEVELMYDDEYGFSAEAHASGRTQILIESNLIEAIRYWLQHQMNRDPYAAALQLELDEQEGIIAYARY